MVSISGIWLFFSRSHPHLAGNFHATASSSQSETHCKHVLLLLTRGLSTSRSPARRAAVGKTQNASVQRRREARGRGSAPPALPGARCASSIPFATAPRRTPHRQNPAATISRGAGRILPASPEAQGEAAEPTERTVRAPVFLREGLGGGSRTPPPSQPTPAPPPPPSPHSQG